MPNITFSVEESALANAKAYASERSTTLNKLVNAYLKSLGQDQPRRSISKADEVLLDYSLGKKSLLDAAESLGLHDGGHVLALMRRAGLPLPQLPEKIVEQQASENLEFYKEARSASPRKTKKAKGPAKKR
jgi:Family of unknown function (DUF6364)